MCISIWKILVCQERSPCHHREKHERITRFLVTRNTTVKAEKTPRLTTRAFDARQTIFDLANRRLIPETGLGELVDLP